jgi:hypothetical protein
LANFRTLATKKFRKVWDISFFECKFEKKIINEKKITKLSKPQFFLKKKKERNPLIRVDNGNFHNFKNKKRIQFQLSPDEMSSLFYFIFGCDYVITLPNSKPLGFTFETPSKSPQ